MTEIYTARIKSIQKHISKLEKLDNLLSVLRLMGFVGFFTILIFAITTGTVFFIASTFIVLIIFVFVLLKHLRNSETLRRERIRIQILENEINCLNHKGNIYYNGLDFVDPDHDFTSDMDIFGPNSLMHYINRCATGVGNLVLSQWLSNKYIEESMADKQKAVQELASMSPWCEELRIGLFNRRITNFKNDHLPSIEKTVAAPSKIKYWISGSWLLLLGGIAGIAFTSAGAILLLLPVIYNLVLMNWNSKFLKTIRVQLDGREKTLSDYQKILAAFENERFTSKILLNMQQKLATKDKTTATQAIRNLQKLSQKLDYSLNFIVGGILNLLFAWDLTISTQITRWFDKYAPQTKIWFQTIGEIEALISLANLQVNHTDWVYPKQSTGEKFYLKGENLGHPLIPVSSRVYNDFTIREPQLMNIVTGSNMAGKSTFLRTLGVNTILARIGAPVCSQYFEISSFRMMTYLTITDSLTENTSTFYREIKRLKKILDSARADNNILLLLDEMLRGTNSADKARGSIAITSELINQRVPSVIATHNLELAALKKKFDNEVENYYFDIVIDNNNRMVFDYKLKEGICRTFNASILLKEIGINIDTDAIQPTKKN